LFRYFNTHDEVHDTSGSSGLFLALATRKGVGHLELTTGVEYETQEI